MWERLSRRLEANTGRANAGLIRLMRRECFVNVDALEAAGGTVTLPDYHLDPEGTPMGLARLIRDRCRVSYYPGHVWHPLDRLGFNYLRPSRQAIERNEAEIARWRRYRWPTLTKRPAAKAGPSSSSTKAD